MRGAVRPRVLAVAAAAVAGLIALGVIASAAVWGFRNGSDQSSSGVGGWLLLLWVAVGVATLMVIGVALAGIRALRRPLEDLSRAASELQAERLPAALRDIEAGAEPAPQKAFNAPPELEGVAGALESLEREVHLHATRAQRADSDLGVLLTGAADRAGARARLAEGIDLATPEAIAQGLHRDEDTLRALVPAPVPSPIAELLAEPEIRPGLSIAEMVDAAAETTLRPTASSVGDLEHAVVDARVGSSVMLVLGEVLDCAIGTDGDVVVHGSLQPEGYHFIVETATGTRGFELVSIADALRDRDPARLPFGLRAAVLTGKRTRLLVWLTVSDTRAQWHLLVPPDCFVAGHLVAATPPTTAEGAIAPAAEPDVVIPAEPTFAPPVVQPVAIVPEPESALTGSAATPAPNGTKPLPADHVRLATARRLGEALADLLARLEAALDGRSLDGRELDQAGRTALLVDGTGLVAELQETDLGSSRARRSLLRALDIAVSPDASTPLAGSARENVTLPYEVLVEIRAQIAEAAGVFPTASSA